RRGARFPPGCLPGKLGGGRFQVILVFDTEGLLPTRHTRRVAQQVPDFYTVLAVLRELGPVVSHRRIRDDFTPVHKPEAGEAGYVLRGRPQVDNRVLGPGDLSLLVAPATPQIDHGLAVDVHVDAGTHLDMRVNVGRERGVNALETRIAGSTQLGHEKL